MVFQEVPLFIIEAVAECNIIHLWKSRERKTPAERVKDTSVLTELDSPVTLLTDLPRRKSTSQCSHWVLFY